MPKKALEPITESMYYVLLCLHEKNMNGSEIAECVRALTSDRVRLGPGTLYSILSTFEEENIIKKLDAEGRRIPYCMTSKGEELFQKEVQRLRKCITDIEGIKVIS
jgi:Predicted transcriptional regulators